MGCVDSGRGVVPLGRRSSISCSKEYRRDMLWGNGSFVSQSAFEKGRCVGFVRGRGVGMGCFGATSIVSSLMILKSCFD